MFFGAFRYLFKKNYFYINTLLPVSAAIAGRLMGKRVVYHYHENADAKGALYKLLSACMQHLATEIICVSEYQRSFLKRQKGVRVVPNRVPADFLAKLQPNPEAAFERKRVLMVGSLKEYKGTKEFVELARRLPDYRFELVLNADPEEVQAQFGDGNRGNLTVWGRQADVSTFYNRASLLLNLSNKELFIETFGLTAVEGMSAGLPVIVPTVGGIAEMVSDGENGYKIDVQDLDKVEEAIRRLLTDRTLYLRMAENALRSSDEINHRKCT
jgi:glycosyltransferase involved in cell wall biosynthesis